MSAKVAPLWLTEGRELSKLALPLIGSNLAWSLISATDLLLLGRLNAHAVAAGALAINLYHAFMVFGMGMAMAVAPLVANARGKKRFALREIRRSTQQSLWAVVLYGLLALGVLSFSSEILLAMGQDSRLVTQASLMMEGLKWGLIPFLCFYVLRNYTAAVERPMWTLIIVTAAIPFNFVAGWALTFGHLGSPALGGLGVGIASSLTALFMTLCMSAIVLRHAHFRKYRIFSRIWVFDWPRLRQVCRLGFPIAVTLGFEITVFNASAFIVGLFGAAPLAAHSIAMQIVNICFMIPFGISQAATVRVGLHAGRCDPERVRVVGRTALLIGVLFAGCSALIVLLFPLPLIAAFIDARAPANQTVVIFAITFLHVVAFILIVDATQAIAAGLLRGLQDTRIPMMVAALGYWVIGIGVGSFLALRLGGQSSGVWIGLAAGLSIAALLLVIRWQSRIVNFQLNVAGSSQRC